ncbi:hypothetical protein BROUX41_005556 [Berkeleyomyces rouxiae]
MASPILRQEPVRHGSPQQPLAYSPSQASKTLHDIDTSTHIYLRNLANLASSRLPKAFPPYASDPSLFATGLLYFMPIFSAVVNAWRQQTSAGGQDIGPTDVFAPYAAAAAANPLITLLAAHERDMRTDISDLCGWDTDDLDRELAAMTAENTFMSDIVAHITRTCSTDPNALLGYCYTLLEAIRLSSDQMRPKVRPAAPHGSTSAAAAAAAASPPASGSLTPATATTTLPPPEFWKKHCSTLRPVAPNLRSRRTGHSRAQPMFAAGITAEQSTARQAQVAAALQTADGLLDGTQIAVVAEEARFLAQSLVEVVQELDVLARGLRAGCRGDTGTPVGAAEAREQASGGGAGMQGAKRKTHPRRAARDSVQLNRERKWCVVGLDELGLRTMYDLQADEGLEDGERAVPRLDACHVADEGDDPQALTPEGLQMVDRGGCGSERRERKIKFDNVMPHRDSE